MVKSKIGLYDDHDKLVCENICIITDPYFSLIPELSEIGPGY